MRGSAARMIMTDIKPQRRNCCTATHTATPTNIGEKDDTQQTENERFKHKMDEDERPRTTQVESPLRTPTLLQLAIGKHSSLPDTIRQSLSRKRDPIPPKNHHKMRAKLGAKPLYPHHQHWTKMDKNCTVLARHPHKSACQ